MKLHGTLNTKPEDCVGSPFKLTDNGVVRFKKLKDERTVAMPVCAPLRVVARVHDTDRQSWGLAVEVVDHADETVLLLVRDRELIDGTEALRRVVDAGLAVFDDDEVAQYLRSCDPRDIAVLKDRVGWIDQGTFMLPDRLIGQPRRPVAFCGPLHHDFEASGTLDDWRNSVGAASRTNSRLALGVCVALAAPLLFIAGEEGLGVHLYGRSSTGKTTAARLAASVWGHPDRFMRPWRSTGNALEALASCRNDCLLVLDEISAADTRTVAESVYTLMNGRGKARLQTTAALREPIKFRLALLSTGERSLRTALRARGTDPLAGQEVRLLNIPADAGAGMGIFNDLVGAPDPNMLARRLASSADGAFGVAGPAFLDVLVRHTDVRGVIEKAVSGMEVPDASSGQVHRAARRLAIAAAAGKIASEAGITGWSAGDAVRAVSSCFRAWLDARTTAGALEGSAGVDRVRDFILRYAESRFVWLRGEDERPVHNRAGYREMRPDGVVYYFLPQVFRDEVCDGLEPEDVARELKDRGLLLHRSSGLRFTKRVPDFRNSISVYAVRSEVVGTDDDALADADDLHDSGSRLVRPDELTTRRERLRSIVARTV